MKRIMLFLVVVIFLIHNVFPASAQQKGIQFFEGTWSQVLTKSKETGKPIFIDVYTEWCGPCKMMAKEIFPLEEVGNKYNDAFINYKIDAEKGEGVGIAKEYKVLAYPTYLYVGKDGDLLFRSGGFSPDPKNFIAQADAALLAAKDPYNVSKMTVDFKNGKKDKDFLKKYIEKLSGLEMDNSEALDAYFLLLTPEARLLPENYNYFLSKMNTSFSRTFDFVIQHLDKTRMQNAVDKGEDRFKPMSMLQEGLDMKIQSAEYEKAGKLIRYINRLKYLEGYDATFVGSQELEYLDKTNKVKEMLNAAKAFVKVEAALSVQKIREENKRVYDTFMTPFLSGERDSTKLEHFDKMKDYYRNQYQMTIATKLFTAANHVANKVKDKAELKTALVWAKKAEVLMPDQQEYRDLSAKLSKQIK